MFANRLRIAATAAILSVVFAVNGSAAHAQDLEPRAYGNTPVDLNFVIAGYGFAEGAVATDAALPLEDFQVRTHVAVFAYVRSLNLWGKSGKIDVLLPYAWVHARAKVASEARKREVSGFGDPKLRFSVNFYGAPALALNDFENYQQDLIVGASIQVSAPFGQYDPDRLVNIGTNRWVVKPELGLSKAWGAFTLELAAGAAFYSDNNDFFGGKTREQEPIYSVQGHLIYHWRPGIWMALDGTYYTGGRTTVEGVKGNDLQKNSRLGVTLALPVSRQHSIKIYGSTGVSTRTGSDFDAIGIAWQYRFGGGL